jgi:hypothetical protein
MPEAAWLAIRDLKKHCLAFLAIPDNASGLSGMTMRTARRPAGSV